MEFDGDVFEAAVAELLFCFLPVETDYCGHSQTRICFARNLNVVISAIGIAPIDQQVHHARYDY